MEFRTVLTTCPYCGCGCGLLLEVLDGKLIGTLPSKTSPVNEGRLCVKGWTVHEFVMSPNRLTKPLVRKGEGLHESSWNEALSLAATRLKEIKEKNVSSEDLEAKAKTALDEFTTMFQPEQA